MQFLTYCAFHAEPVSTLLTEAHQPPRISNPPRPPPPPPPFYSDILGETFKKVKITTAVMRTMKKYGGLDGYLLNTPERKLADSDFGRKLQRRIK